MKDIVFYPLAVILGTGVLILALLPGIGALPSGPVSVGDGRYEAVSVSGLQVNRMQPGGNAALSLVEAGPESAIRIDVEADTLSDDPVLGPHFPLAADLEVQFSGFEIEITVRAKPGPERGATAMRMNYSTGRHGESGWQEFALKPDYQDYSFTYEVPVHRGDQGFDYLGIRPIVPDKSRSLLVEAVEFKRLKRWAE